MKRLAAALARRRMVRFCEVAQQDTAEDEALRARGAFVFRIGSLRIVMNLSPADEPEAR